MFKNIIINFIAFITLFNFCILILLCSYEVIQTLDKEKHKVEGPIYYYLFNFLLFSLLVLHIYWWVLMYRMLVRQVQERGRVSEDVRSGKCNIVIGHVQERSLCYGSLQVCCLFIIPIAFSSGIRVCFHSHIHCSLSKPHPLFLVQILKMKISMKIDKVNLLTA